MTKISKNSLKKLDVVNAAEFVVLLMMMITMMTTEHLGK